MSSLADFIGEERVRECGCYLNTIHLLLNCLNIVSIICFAKRLRITYV